MSGCSVSAVDAARVASRNAGMIVAGCEPFKAAPLSGFGGVGRRLDEVIDERLLGQRSERRPDGIANRGNDRRGLRAVQSAAFVGIREGVGAERRERAVRIREAEELVPAVGAIRGVLSAKLQLLP